MTISRDLAFEKGWTETKQENREEADRRIAIKHTLRRIADSRILITRIGESGLSSGRFATEVLKRDERTIRRWKSGESPMPEAVRRFLRDPVPAPWPNQTTMPILP